MRETQAVQGSSLVLGSVRFSTRIEHKSQQPRERIPSRYEKDLPEPMRLVLFHRDRFRLWSGLLCGRRDRKNTHERNNDQDSIVVHALQYKISDQVSATPTIGLTVEID